MTTPFTIVVARVVVVVGALVVVVAGAVVVVAGAAVAAVVVGAAVIAVVTVTVVEALPLLQERPADKMPTVRRANPNTVMGLARPMEPNSSDHNFGPPQSRWTGTATIIAPCRQRTAACHPDER